MSSPDYFSLYPHDTNPADSPAMRKVVEESEGKSLWEGVADIRSQAEQEREISMTGSIESLLGTYTIDAFDDPQFKQLTTLREAAKVIVSGFRRRAKRSETVASRRLEISLPPIQVELCFGSTGILTHFDFRGINVPLSDTNPLKHLSSEKFEEATRGLMTREVFNVSGLEPMTSVRSELTTPSDPKVFFYNPAEKIEEIVFEYNFAIDGFEGSDGQSTIVVPRNNMIAMFGELFDLLPKSSSTQEVANPLDLR